MSTDVERITELEQEIFAKKAEVSKLRRAQPPKPVEDFTFQGPEGPVKLSELFAGKPDLVLVSNMGKSCNYCTLWADGFNGMVPELESRAGFALVSADPIEVLKEFAGGRGWRFRWVSGDRAFRDAMRLSGGDGTPEPAALGLWKDENGAIFEIARDGFGEGDNFCVTWHLFDLLKDGWGGWDPAERL